MSKHKNGSVSIIKRFFIGLAFAGFLAFVGVVIFVVYLGSLVGRDLGLVGSLPGGEWNTKTSLVIETPTGLVEGSVVRTYSVQVQPKVADGGGMTSYLRGEALAIEVLPDRWLFGLVNESGYPVRVEAANSKELVAWYTTRPEGEGRDIVINPQTVYEKVPEDARPQERRMIQSRNKLLPPRSTYPGTLVTFDDINDPSTIELVDLADLEATFGEGVKFVSGRYEFTKEPRTEGRIRDTIQLKGSFIPEDELDENVQFPITAFRKTANGWKANINWGLFKTR